MSQEIEENQRSRQKKRKARRRKKIILLAISGSLLLGFLLVGGGIIVGQIFKKNEPQPVVEETTTVIEETTKPVEKVITPEMEAKLADYTAVLSTIKQVDISEYGEEHQATITILMTETEKLLLEKTVESLEEKINTLAYEVDRFHIESGTGDLFYQRGILVANKVYCLPSDFYPGESHLARAGFEQMASAAAEEGINLYDFSTFRSYGTQSGLYDRYVAADGEAAANRYSAKPGCSEHQTGLAFDIGGDNQSRWAEVTFDGTPEAEWLANNAHRFGFILRYPEGKEDITGYMHESWHYRFVGDIAPRIKESGISTLEEYLGLV